VNALAVNFTGLLLTVKQLNSSISAIVALTQPAPDMHKTI
jgi:hypothetical protein